MKTGSAFFLVVWVVCYFACIAKKKADVNSVVRRRHLMRRPWQRACDITMAVSFKRLYSARRYPSFNRDAEGAAERHASPID